jgi:hypothetical protein
MRDYVRRAEQTTTGMMTTGVSHFETILAPDPAHA